MAVASASSRPRYYLLLVVLTAVTLIVVSGNGESSIVRPIRSVAHDAFAPLADASDAVMRPIANATSSVFHYGEIKDENQRLRDELQRLQGSALQNDQLRRELDVLGTLNNLSFIHNIPGVDARVSASSTSNFEASIEISKGSNAGIARGMPVVGTSGLVGRVTEVSKTRSVVTLLTDSSMAVGVRMSRNGDVGVAAGAGQGRDLRIDMIAPESDVQVGDGVVTSGLQSSLYPPDIPVGKVATAPRIKAGDLQRSLTVKPLVNFSQLSFVRVLQWSPISN